MYNRLLYTKIDMFKRTNVIFLQFVLIFTLINNGFCKI